MKWRQAKKILVAPYIHSWHQIQTATMVLGRRRNLSLGEQTLALAYYRDIHAAKQTVITLAAGARTDRCSLIWKSKKVKQDEQD